MKKPRSRDGRFADTLRGVGTRFSILFFVVVSVVLLVVGRVEPRFLERARELATDGAAPILDLASRPVGAATDLTVWVENIIYLHRENQRLRIENERLHDWQTAAETLAVENERLRVLAGLNGAEAGEVTTARIIGQAGGKFVQSVLINAGTRDGVARNQTVADGNGVLGRIISVGRHSARVLLVNDLNSRIPVKILPDGVNAILIGDNRRDPQITFLPAETEINPGDWVVTTGHGGTFPPDMAVGRILETVGSRMPRVRLNADLDRLDYVRVLSYAPPPNPDSGPTPPDDPDPQAP
ncbi:MAG: rod shape-determining protein MreC [Sphingomonadales bacterium]